MKRALIATSLLICTTIYVTVMSHGEPVLPRKSFAGFPKTIGQWVGTEDFFSKATYDVLRVDDSVLVNYRNHKGKRINLYVGFYQNQREGQIIHSPKNCLPGGGWKIIRTSSEALTLPGSPSKKINVIKFLLEKGVEQQVVLYWYQSRGRFIDSEYWQKIFLVYDAISKNRTDGSFVRLMTPVGERGEEIATSDLKAFAADLIPILEEYIPGA